MFPALIFSSSGGTLYTVVGIFCVCYVGWLLAGLEWNWFLFVLRLGHKCLKHVEGINCTELKVNSASCWSYYTDIQGDHKISVHYGT
jgi:hypothetical protein